MSVGPPPHGRGHIVDLNDVPVPFCGTSAPPLFSTSPSNVDSGERSPTKLALTVAYQEPGEIRHLRRGSAKRRSPNGVLGQPQRDGGVGQALQCGPDVTKAGFNGAVDSLISSPQSFINSEGPPIRLVTVTMRGELLPVDWALSDAVPGGTQESQASRVAGPFVQHAGCRL